jgi:hypothetical protein
MQINPVGVLSWGVPSEVKGVRGSAYVHEEVHCFQRDVSLDVVHLEVLLGVVAAHETPAALHGVFAVQGLEVRVGGDALAVILLL